MILALRTDKPEAELYLYNDATEVARYRWLAHRELSDTLLIKIEELLKSNVITSQSLTGICVYQGPGSFTGLRIGITIANTLAYSLNLPIVGAPNEDWLEVSLKKCASKRFTQIILPVYGSETNITKPKK